MKNYFPHDSDARSDDKIIALRIKHRWEGYGLYWALIEKLRDSNDYTLKADYNGLAFDLRADAAILKSVINDFGLFAFTDNGECFYSESLCTRMKPLDDKKASLSDAGKRGNIKRWGNRTGHPVQKSPPDTNPIATQSPPDRLPTEKPSQEEIRLEEIREKEKLSIESQKKAEQEKKLVAAKAATLARKQKFGESLIPYTQQYGKEMIRAFFDYWSELNKLGTKMRVDKQDTWEVAKRLATWSKKEKFDGKPISKTTNSTANQRKESVDGTADIAREILRQAANRDKFQTDI